MKFNLNGATVEIKVTPVGAKKENPVSSQHFADTLSLALLHASNFCTGQGLAVQADEYMEIAKAIMLVHAE